MPVWLTMVLSTPRVSIHTVGNRKLFILEVWKRDLQQIPDNHSIKEKWLLIWIKRLMLEVKWARLMLPDSTNSLTIEIMSLHLELVLKNQYSRKVSEVEWEMMFIVSLDHKLDLRDQVSFLKLLLRDRENMPLNQF